MEQLKALKEENKPLHLVMSLKSAKSHPKGTGMVLEVTQSPCCYLHEIFRVFWAWLSADGEAGMGRDQQVQLSGCSEPLCE